MPDAQLLIRSLKSGYKFEDLVAEATLRLDSQGHWMSYRCGANLYRRCMNGDVVTDNGARQLSRSEKKDLLGGIEVALSHWLSSWKGG